MENPISKSRRPTRPYLRLRNSMMAFVSVTVLCGSLFIILSGRYDDASQKWAFGSVTAIFLFWHNRK